MVSKNNLRHKLEETAHHVPHYGLRKLSVGVASVLLSTTLYFGATAHAATDEATTQGSNGSADATDQMTDASAESKIQQPVVKIQAKGADQQTTTATDVNQTTDTNDSEQVETESVDQHQSLSAKRLDDTSVTADDIAANEQNDRGNETQVEMPISQVGSDISSREIASQLSEDDTNLPKDSVSVDASHNYPGYTTGEANKSVTLADGSTLTLTNTIMNADHPTTTLRFQSNSFRAGDVYKIYIPAAFVNSETADNSGISTLDPNYGQTEIMKSNGSTFEGYYVVTDRFTVDSSASIYQDIVLKLATNQTLLGNLFGNKAFDPYSLIKGQIKIVKGDETATIDASSQVGTLSFLVDPSITLANGSLGYPINNHQTYKGRVAATFHQSNQFLSGFSLAQTFHNLTTSFHVPDGFTLKSDQVVIKDNDGNNIGTATASISNHVVTINNANFDANANATYNENTSIYLDFDFAMDLADDQFDSQGVARPQITQLTYQIDTPNPGVTLLGSGNNTDLTVQKDIIPTSGAIQFKQKQIAVYQNGVNHAFGNFSQHAPSVDVTVDGDIWKGTSSIAEYISPLQNTTNDVFNNVNVTINLPDGIELYSMRMGTYDSLTNVDKITVTLNDGSTVALTPDQWENGTLYKQYHMFDIVIGDYHYDSALYPISIGNDDNYIKSITMHYRQVNGGENIGITASDPLMSYKIADKYTDGSSVKVGDILTLNTTVSGSNLTSSTKWTTKFLVVDRQRDAKGDNPRIIPTENSTQPATSNAGQIEYSLSSFNESGTQYAPQITKPVAYLMLPDCLFNVAR